MPQYPNINFKQGTISFWIKANFKWNDNEKRTLFRFSQQDGKENGKISIIKNSKNVLKATYKAEGIKRILSFDTKNLSNNKRRYVVFTWSKKRNKIILYFDHEKVSENKFR